MSDPIEFTNFYFNDRLKMTIHETCYDMLSEKKELNIEEKKTAYRNCVYKSLDLTFPHVENSSEPKI
jgi:hypothetical protein